MVDTLASLTLVTSSSLKDVVVSSLVMVVTILVSLVVFNLFVMNSLFVNFVAIVELIIVTFEIK